MTSDNNAQKNCGFCGESIPLRAGRCPYCGSILEVTVDSTYHINHMDPRENTAAPQNAATPESPNITENPDIMENPVMTGNPDEQEKPAMTDHSAEPVNPGTQNERGITENTIRPYNNFRSIPERKPENNVKYPLSNGMKVFLTVICTIIPGLGQLAGIITAIIFMNTDDDSDRKSFGVALLVASLVMFVFACIGCFILVIAISSSSQMLY